MDGGKVFFCPFLIDAHYCILIYKIYIIHQVGDLTFPILCEYAESEVFTVNDLQMIAGMKLAWERMKVSKKF